MRTGRLQFHLSTLILLCIFVGAVIALLIGQNPWKEIEIADARSMDRVLKDYAPGQPNLYSLNELSEDMPGYSRFRTEKERIEVFSGYVKIHVHPDKPDFDCVVLNTKAPIKALFMSSDLRHMVVANPERVHVYRRMRDYGSMMQLPHLWIACAALLALVISVWRSNLKRAKNPYSPPSNPAP